MGVSGRRRQGWSHPALPGLGTAPWWDGSEDPDIPVAGCAVTMAGGRAGPSLSLSPGLRGKKINWHCLRLVVFEQLCASARRKLGQLHFWVLSQRIGVELARLLAPLLAGKAGKLLLVPFGDGEGEPSLGSGLPTLALACCPAGRCVWLLANQVTPACSRSARDGNAGRN